jgi:beta-glucosidase
METLKFSKDFLWGTSTSAYQVEGGIENSDWSQEFPAGKACDHYNLYEKDFKLLKKLNQNAFRLSIEWSRIEPEPGKFNKKEIEHYRKVLSSLKKKKTKVMLTLHHFTTPWWLVEIGEWENSDVVFYFSRFAKRVFTEYFDFVDFWQTINEPLIYASLGYLEGIWPPETKSFIAFLRVINNQIVCHKEVFKNFHKLKPEVKVGIAKSNVYFEPFNLKSILDRFNAWINRYFWNEFFLNRIRNHLDFIGLNYYFHQRIKFPAQNKNENKVVSDVGWEIYPKGIYHALKELKKYNLPIYITENGLADAKDELRKDFIKDHLSWIHKAIQEDIDVKGYFHWSLLDNFEWEKGFEPRFGLVEIDYKDLKRKPRPSSKFYAKVSKQNALILNS